jgi:hypothetical protein
MRRVLVVVLAMALLPAASAGATVKPIAPAKVPWMTKSIRDRISAAGTKGVRISTVRRWYRLEMARRGKPAEDPPAPCPTADPSSAQAFPGACMVAPAGCTMNFLFKLGPGAAGEVSDGRSYFLGTAGHCVDHSNQHVFLSNDAAVYDVGTVAKHMNGGIGNDYAIVQLAKGTTMDPSDPAGGPQGIYTGCDPQGVKYYGHGGEVVVVQGHPGGGLATEWFDREYAWDGTALGGDSGSAVMLVSDEAAGNLTHLVIDPARYGIADTAGTRISRALSWMGGNYYLVNADHTTVRATQTKCGSSNAGGGSGAATGILSSLLGG